MGHLGHKIKLIDRQFRSRMDKNLENLGITTAQMNVLCYMEHHTERNVTQKQLSEAFNVKHSTMAGILQRMVEKDLLEIRPIRNLKIYSLRKKLKVFRIKPQHIVSIRNLL